MNAAVVFGFPDPHEIAEMGRRIYREKYQSEFEARHPGQIVAIDIVTKRAFLAPSVEEAVENGHRACPASLFHVLKVGAPAVYKVR